MADEASIPESNIDRETAAAHYEQAVCDALIAALEAQIARLNGELVEIRTKRRGPGRSASAGQIHARAGEPSSRPVGGESSRRSAA